MMKMMLSAKRILIVVKTRFVLMENAGTFLYQKMNLTMTMMTMMTTMTTMMVMVVEEMMTMMTMKTLVK